MGNKISLVVETGVVSLEIIEKEHDKVFWYDLECVFTDNEGYEVTDSPYARKESFDTYRDAVRHRRRIVMGIIRDEDPEDFQV